MTPSFPEAGGKTWGHARITGKPSPSSQTPQRTFGTAIERWAGVGPYYAMFPVQFAFSVVRQYSAPGSAVLDPFAGRASSVYAAAALGRRGFGIEINPVGWLYGTVKLNPAAKASVLRRLSDVAEIADTSIAMQDATRELPVFFSAAYCSRVRRFLVAARDLLAWRTNRVDATLMTFVLMYLHGKRMGSLSNQMRDGKAMSPNYSVTWWEDREMRPPRLDPVAFLSKRIEWRYKYGAPALRGNMRLGDSVQILADVRRRVERKKAQRFGLLFTSPPYMGVTNYHYDQWLRLWMLGWPDYPAALGGNHKGKFASRADYTALVEAVFEGAAPLLTQGARVYVRTDARQFTRATTLDTLKAVFPRKKLTIFERPLEKRSQTALFGDVSDKPGEVDIVLT